MLQRDVVRFWAKVQKGSSEECWPWVGGTQVSGYGQFWFEGRYWIATEFMLLLQGELRQGGLFILHKCDNKSCVNPKHLYWGTQADNMRDRAERHPGWKNDPAFIVRKLERRAAKKLLKKRNRDAALLI
jgi:hypothetical protein